MASKVQAEKALRQQMEDEKNKTSAANQSEAVICIVDAAKLYKQELGDNPGLNVHTELGTCGDNLFKIENSRMGDTLKKIKEIKFIIDTLQWIETHNTKSKKAGTATTILSKDVALRLTSLFNAALTSLGDKAQYFQTSPTLVGAHVKWSGHIFNRQLFRLTPLSDGQEWRHLGALPFCCTEVRYLLSGSLSVFGVPFSSFKDTKDNILSMRREFLSLGLAELKAKVQLCGSYITITEPGTMLVLPRGWMYVLMGSGDTSGIRWSVFDSKSAPEYRSVADELTQTLKAFPVLQSTPMQEFSKWLDDASNKPVVSTATSVGDA